MKKLLITVCLSGLLSVPSAVLGAEMAGPSLYGSFRAGLSFGSGDASVSNYGSRWGFTGSYEVSEGLTASYKYETGINTTTAETSGGAGHGHDQQFVVGNAADEFTSSLVEADLADMHEDFGNSGKWKNSCVETSAFAKNKDDDYETVDTYTVKEVEGAECGNLFDNDADSDPGGRHSNIALSGGFGTVTLGQNWSASALHYGFAVDGSILNGSFGGASGRNGSTISYASSAGDVSFQIDKTTGKERIEFGASAALGPVGIGFGYWKSGAGNESAVPDGASFTGIAISAGAGTVDLTIGLGSESGVLNKAKEVIDRETSIIKAGGSLGDSGVSYVVQVANSDDPNKDQNTVSVTNNLGGGASLIFEHWDPGVGDASTFLGLKVDF